MDLKGRKYFEAPPMFPSQSQQDAAAMATGGNSVFCKTGNENPLMDLDAFHDPLCKLNLKETSEFVKSFPMTSSGSSESGVFLDVSAAQRREGLSSITKRPNVEAPPTPGRPIFSFSVGNHSKKTFPSKWDDAEKWLISGTSCHESPAHHHHHHHQGSKQSEYSKTTPKPCNVFKPQQAAELVAEKSRAIDEKVSKVVSALLPLDHHYSSGAFCEGPTFVDVLLKDKYTREAEQSYPSFKCSEPMKEGFVFANATEKYVKEAANDVKHRDIGTQMSPLGSSTTSRCPTPFLSTSPARYNTPADRSGPLALPNSGTSPVDITQLKECHLAKLQFDSVTSNWSSREEEEEELSKSLRHFEINNECRRSISEFRTCAWEEEEKTKSCLRYQREEAKIQAWVNLQSAKAEAQSRKLEVKIQKMRSNLEEKLMKRMGIVHRKAEEWRATARLQHSEQIQKACEQGRKMTMSRHHNSYFTSNNSCGCFPCSNDHKF